MADSDEQDPPFYKFNPPSESEALKDPRDKKPLIFFPGHESVPVRGLTKDSVVTPEELQKLVEAYDIHFRIFDLASPSDLELYERLQTAAATSGHVRVIRETEAKNVGEGGHWRVGCKWYERYYQPRRVGIFRSDGNPLGAE